MLYGNTDPILSGFSVRSLFFIQPQATSYGYEFRSGVAAKGRSKAKSRRVCGSCQTDGQSV